MTMYLPEGVDLRRAGYDYDPDQEPVTVNGGAPLVDPLALDPCEKPRAAAERVAQHIDQASQDPTTWVLQWHAAAIEIHPHTITEEAFYKTWMEHFPHDGRFPTEAHYQEFIDTIQQHLRKATDYGADVQ